MRADAGLTGACRAVLRGRRRGHPRQDGRASSVLPPSSAVRWSSGAAGWPGLALAGEQAAGTGGALWWREPAAGRRAAAARPVKVGRTRRSSGSVPVPEAGPVFPQVRQVRQEPGPAAGAAALHRTRRDAQHVRGRGDRVSEHVHQDQRRPLPGGQQLQRRLDVERGVAGRCRIRGRPALPLAERVQRRLIVGRHGRPRRLAAQLVQAGVHDDPVQPGGHRRVAAELRRPAERGDHRLLQRVRGVIRVVQRAQGHRPEPVAVAAEQLAERVGVAVGVAAQQLGV